MRFLSWVGFVYVVSALRSKSLDLSMWARRGGRLDAHSARGIRGFASNTPFRVAAHSPFLSRISKALTTYAHRTGLNTYRAFDIPPKYRLTISLFSLGMFSSKLLSALARISLGKEFSV